MTHDELQTWIRDHYSDRFEVSVEVDKPNRLVLADGVEYRPDVVIRNRRGEVRYLIEVESLLACKATAGACLLANLAARAIGNRSHPLLIFVAYGQRADRRVNSCKKRLRLLNDSLPHLKGVKVMSSEQFMNSQLP